MPIINKQEIKKLIAFHEKQISALSQLLDISTAIEGAKPLSGKMLAEALKGARGRADGGKKGKKKRAKRKRGAVSSAILDVIKASGKPMASGVIRTHLESKGLATKGSSAVYAMLLQLANKGVLKKSKTTKGIAYSLAGAVPKAKK